MWNDRLQATLTLVIGSATHAISAGAISRLDLEARVYGFSAQVSFRVSSEGETDEVFKPFTGTDLIQATLAVANGRLTLSGETPVVSTFVGIVTERALEETISKDIEGEPIVDRLYTIKLEDPAAVLWRSHRPLQVYANKSLQQVIEANLVKNVKLSCEWAKLAEAKDIVCVGLGGTARASFYDFVVGVVSDLCGVMELDPATSTYRLSDRKADGGEAKDIDAESVAKIVVEPPVIKRHAAAVLNHFTGATVSKSDVANTLSATGVRTDVMAYTLVPAQMDQRVTLETSRLKQRDHHVRLTFSRLPPAFPAPGTLWSVGEGFSTKIVPSGKSYRAVVLRVHAEEPSGDDERDDSVRDEPSAVFQMDVTVEMERDSDAVPNLPPFEPCSYPVLAEGKVLSASGAETDRTWYSMAGENDSVVRYRVEVPLWNQTVVVPFVPFGESGHFFFPAYKHQRVLLAFEFDSAKIISFLDWAGKLSTESQGNQLVMGKRDTSGTIMKHVFTDNSPVLTVVRTQAGDKQTMELSEGRFFLEVREDESSEKPAQTYDLTPQADVAKEQASSKAQAGISQMTGNYQASMDAASGSLQSARADVQSQVGSATAELSGKLQSVEDQLSGQTSEIEAATDEASAQVAQAKAELEKALEDD